jgi:hypothetical protein
VRAIVLALVLAGCTGSGASPQVDCGLQPDAQVPSCAFVDCVPGRIACGYFTDAGVFEHPEICTCELPDGSVTSCHN